MGFHLVAEICFEAMYSNSLLPMILKPTQGTDTAATLTDNTLTNKCSINDNIFQGTCIFATDFLDHYMIYHISDKWSPYVKECQLFRLMNESRKTKYKECILDTDWFLLNEYDTRESYFSSFMNIFKFINNQFSVFKAKMKYKNHLPWLTSAVKESIKRKKKTYIEFHNNIIHPTILLYANNVGIK